MKKILSAIKPYLRWLIFGGTLFFVLKAFKDNWHSVAAVHIDLRGWLILAIALTMTLLAHIWSAWVWTWILKDFKQPIGGWKAVCIYLITNMAKYLPGNIGHLYSRIVAVSKAGSSLGVASISVLLEPLLMATAALLVALISRGMGWIKIADSVWNLRLEIFILILILVGIHPYILNRVLSFLNRSKNKKTDTESVKLEKYPLVPLSGEIAFLLFRSSGFILTWIALTPVNFNQTLSLLSAFSFAWLLGLIIPGAPGGMGVFEAVAIALLDDQHFSVGIILSTVALFRVISILAEVIAAKLAWLIKSYLSMPAN